MGELEARRDAPQADAKLALRAQEAEAAKQALSDCSDEVTGKTKRRSSSHLSDILAVELLR